MSECCRNYTSERENFAVGLVRGLLAVVVFVLYTAILIVLRKEKHKFSSPSFRIIFHLGIADLLTLFGYTSAVPFTIIGTEIPLPLNKICGALAAGFFTTVVSHTFTLALDRFLVICLHGKTESALRQLHLIEILLAGGWVWGFGLLAALLTPYCDVLYTLRCFSWEFSDDTLCFIVNGIQMPGAIFQLILSGILYVAIVVQLAVTRFSIKKRLLQISVTNLPQRRGYHYNEVLVFIQAFIITSFAALCHVLWYEVTACWAILYLNNTLSMLLCGINPFVYMVFNRSIRVELLKAAMHCRLL